MTTINGIKKANPGFFAEEVIAYYCRKLESDILWKKFFIISEQVHKPKTQPRFYMIYEIVASGGIKGSVEVLGIDNFASKELAEAALSIHVGG